MTDTLHDAASLSSPPERESIGVLSTVRDGSRAFFLVAALLTNAALWVVVFLTIGAGDETVVFRYNAYFGIDLTSRARHIFILPAIALALLFLHAVFSVLFFRNKEPFAATLLLVSGFLIQVGMAIAVAAIIIVN